MRTSKWMLALIGLLACGLIAAGCGDDDDEEPTTSATTTEETTDDSTTTEDTSSDDDSGSEGATADDVLAACQDAIAGTPAESAGEAGCQAAAGAFEQCATQAEEAPDSDATDIAIKACQDSADAAVDALNAAQ